MKSIFPKFNAS